MDGGSLFRLNESEDSSEYRYKSDEPVAGSDDVGRIRSALGPKLVHSHTPEELERKWRFRKELISLTLTILLVLVIAGGFLMYARMQGLTLSKAVAFVKEIAPSSEPEATVQAPEPAAPVKKKARRARAAADSNRSPDTTPLVVSEPADSGEAQPRRAVRPLLLAQVIDARQRRILQGDNTQSRITVDWSRQTPLWSNSANTAYIPAVAFLDSERPLAQTLREPRRVNVRQGGGQLVHQVMPAYPSDALQQKIEGAVVMQATVGKDGTVSNVQPVSGPPSLVLAAVDAVRQWRYAPYMHDGQAEAFTAEITVDFALTEK